jgi:hypothetical protein
MTQDLLSSAAAAARLGVDRSTLNRWVAAGRISTVAKLPGLRGPFVFAAAEVDRVAAERTAGAALAGDVASAGEAYPDPPPDRGSYGHDVVCSRCGAPAGKDCVTSTGSRAFPPHHVRVVDAHAARSVVAR